MKIGIVADRLGHSTGAVTRAIYLHPLEEFDRANVVSGLMLGGKLRVVEGRLLLPTPVSAAIRVFPVRNQADEWTSIGAGGRLIGIAAPDSGPDQKTT